ncbi:MAG: hypothetical protein ACRDRP_23055 [Pseudonocardiaceae bacterium]
MRLTLLAKDQESGKAGSESVYLAENGKLVIQGGLLDQATRANLLNLLAGEGAVEIDVDIVRAALTKLK